MKTFIFFIVFLLSLNSYSQKLGTQNLFFLMKAKDTESKIDLLLSKSFEQQNSSKDSNLKFVKKDFNKRTQEMDEEIVLITNDSLNYILKNPKKFINLKNAIEFECKANPIEKNGDITVYKNRYYFISIREEEILISESIIKRSYIFSITKKK